jgi:hypothetical protein
MGLLAPLFLLAGLAVAVPLLIHLVQKERRDPTAFPSLMFLEATPVPLSARRHIRDPLLFALRVLAVIALALAFARPVWSPTPRAAALDARRRDIVLLVDRSFSMRTGDRWRHARLAADSVVRSLTSGDRLIVAPFDRRATAVTALTGDAQALRAGLDSLAPTDAPTRLAPAIAFAQQRVLASTAPRKVVAIISDLQRSSWDLTDEAAMPAGTEVVVRAVTATDTAARHPVRDVTIQPGREPTREVEVRARVGGAGDGARAVPVRLEIGGRVIESRTVDLRSEGAATVSFAPVPMPPMQVGARVVAGSDSSRADRAFNFVLQQPSALGVLVIDGQPSPYVPRALTIGEASRFDVRVTSASRATANDLSGRRVIVLPDGAFPTAIGAARLVSFVEQGGGLIVALGARASPGTWPSAADALIPGAIGAPINRSANGGGVLGPIDAQHPALAAVARDLSAARFNSYRAIDTTAGILARFDDGRVAIAERVVGRGRVIAIGSSLDGEWNDLPRQPAFLPLLHQLTRFAAAWRDIPRAFEVGATVRVTDLSPPEQSDVPRWSVVAPSGRRFSVDATGSAPTLELREAGMYELRPGGAPGARPLLVAANIAAAERDLATFEPLRLTQALAPKAGVVPSNAPATEPESASDREARQSTWWYLLLAVTLLLIGESIVARRTAAPTVGTR